MPGCRHAGWSTITTRTAFVAERLNLRGPLCRGRIAARPTAFAWTRCKSGWLFRPPIRRTTHIAFDRTPTIRAAFRDFCGHTVMTLSLDRYRAEWFSGVGNARRDLLAGMVGTFALIPEVIAFSFVAGIDPQVGLFASFIIGVVIAFTGGRPAMISGAAGSVALVAAALVHAQGLQYLLAATPLAGGVYDALCVFW